MVKKKVKSKARDRQATEDCLLTAAEKVFSKHGFQGATTREIAKVAGVNLSLINRYFGGKYDLMLKIIIQKAENFSSRELPYPPRPTVTEELIWFSRTRIDQFYENLNFLKIALVQLMTDPKFNKHHKYIESVFASYNNIETRLKNLISNEKMKNNYSIPELISNIDDFIFSQIINKAIIAKEDKETIYKNVESFLKIYCSNLEV